MNRSRLRARRSASASVSAQTANTAALARGAPRLGEGRNARAYARVTSAPPSALMKWANENAVPKCAAQAALASVEPRSQISGALWPGRHRAHRRRTGGRAAGRRVRNPMRSRDLVGEARDLALRPRVGDSGPAGASAPRRRASAVRRVASGRAADAEVDAPRVERLEHPELLGHLERAVVGEHDAARAHADPARPRPRPRRSGSPGRRRRARAWSGARRASSGGSRAGRRPARGRGSPGWPRPGSAPPGPETGRGRSGGGRSTRSSATRRV